MKKISKSIILLSLFVQISCVSNFEENTKVVFALRQKYDFQNVEINWSKDTIHFNLQDIDHNDVPIKQLRSFATQIDKYTTAKFKHLNKYHTKKYILAGTGGFEIVEFAIDSLGIIYKTRVF